MFSVSSRVRYGMRALVKMASAAPNSPLSVKAIASDQKISRKYLENIFILFRRANIVRSVRGPEGGYVLRVKPDKLTIFQIVDALEGPINTLGCIQSAEACRQTVNCGNRSFWNDFQKYLETYLEEKTLKDVMDRYFIT